MWPLIGVAVVVLGFALRLNALLVIVCAALATGLAAGIPLLGVLATTRASLFDGVRTVLATDAAIVLAAALLVAVGLGLSRKRG